MTKIDKTKNDKKTAGREASDVNAVVSCADMVREYLIKNGYDGLCEKDGECGCQLSDLMPCGGDYTMTCEAGWKREGDGEYDFYIVPGKKPKHR